MRVWLIVALLALAGCTMNTRGSTSATPVSAREAATVRADLAAQLADIEAAQAAALALWDRVIFGEIVSCQEAIPVPPPVTLSAPDRAAHLPADAIQAQLNAARQAVVNASNLWDIECSEPREAVPLEMARAGRDNALAAADPLQEAAALLATWQ